jgi:NAD(P)-dependent dehydrogenase (short-subunit alcohol dehydrogenase family)
MSSLDGKIVFITGAAQGIGKAISMKLAGEGGTIILTDKNKETLEETLKEIKAISKDSDAFVMDVTKTKDIQETVKKALDKFKTIDILVNNAGVITLGYFWDLTEEEWDLHMDVNIKGYWNVSKHIAPTFIKNKSGKIINIASMAAREGYPLASHYSASKFAVLGFTQAIGKELAKYNVNVNAVCPGFVTTDMQERETVWEAEIRGGGMTADDVKQEYIDMTPLGRLCYPEDVARVVKFLASEDAEFITRQGINVTGGALV